MTNLFNKHAMFMSNLRNPFDLYIPFNKISFFQYTFQNPKYINSLVVVVYFVRHIVIDYL